MFLLSRKISTRIKHVGEFGETETAACIKKRILLLFYFDDDDTDDFRDPELSL